MFSFVILVKKAGCSAQSGDGLGRSSLKWSNMSIDVVWVN